MVLGCRQARVARAGGVSAAVEGQGRLSGARLRIYHTSLLLISVPRSKSVSVSHRSLQHSAPDRVSAAVSPVRNVAGGSGREAGSSSSRKGSSPIRRGRGGRSMATAAGLGGGRGNGAAAGRRGGEERLAVETVEEAGGVVMKGAGTSLGTMTAKVPPSEAALTPLVVSETGGGDFDQPARGFAPIVDAVEAVKRGEFVVVVDDEDRENEGDLILAACHADARKVAFMVEHTSGFLCVGMKGDHLDALHLPLMVEAKDNEEQMRTAFTVTVDAKVGTTTGISASDRATTIRLLADECATPDSFRRPGHVLPLRCREGGVLKRAGHTEAAADLCVLAGLPPAGLLCEIVDRSDPEGGMARLPALQAFAKQHGLLVISIADLVRYQRKRQVLVERTAVARLPTKFGTFQAYSYRSKLDGIEHVAMVKGEIGDGTDVLVRVHSECLTGDIFGSRRCDCGNQLALAMQKIEEAGRGVVVYLRGHEGRGIGLGHKLQAYNLQDKGRDTVQANVDLGLPVDSREYGIGAQMLRDIGVKTMRLMTNNPAKFVGLRGFGLAITGRVPVVGPVNSENRRYLETKRSKMGHIYGQDRSLTAVLQSYAGYNSEEEDGGSGGVGTEDIGI